MIPRITNRLLHHLSIFHPWIADHLSDKHLLNRTRQTNLSNGYMGKIFIRNLFLLPTVNWWWKSWRSWFHEPRSCRPGLSSQNPTSASAGQIRTPSYHLRVPKGEVELTKTWKCTWLLSLVNITISMGIIAYLESNESHEVMYEWIICLFSHFLKFWL